MKTILYQPLFINPQAYFVFPQLYHIEKGDSYIEPANIKRLKYWQILMQKAIIFI